MELWSNAIHQRCRSAREVHPRQDHCSLGWGSQWRIWAHCRDNQVWWRGEIGSLWLTMQDSLLQIQFLHYSDKYQSFQEAVNNQVKTLMIFDLKCFTFFFKVWSRLHLSVPHHHWWQSWKLLSQTFLGKHHSDEKHFSDQNYFVERHGQDQGCELKCKCYRSISIGHFSAWTKIQKQILQVTFQWKKR